ncbi:YceI family protein [Flavitalea flava]
MKRLPTHHSILFIITGVLLGCLAFSNRVTGQTTYQSAGGVKLVIEGTSNIHDWEMVSDKGICSAVFEVNNSGIPTGISALNFSVPAESLKSEHKAMDKNTYKALGTDKYASISFVAPSASIKAGDGSVYELVAKGKLTISGVTKEVILTAAGIMNPDKSITYSGSYQLKMTDFKVKPPTIMLGSIKTGNTITVKYNLVLKSA